MIKYDPISLMIYVIIIIIIYFVIAVILKFFEYYLMLPIFNDFNNYVIEHPLLLFPRLIYSLIYATAVISIATSLFTLIITVLIILYITRNVLLFMIPKIPIPIGIIIYETVPPFIQLEEAGIFNLIDNIIEALFKSIPFLQKFIINFSKIMVTFSRDKFLDLVKEVNPDIELDKSQFNKVFIERFMNTDNIYQNKSIKDIIKESKIKMKKYIEKFEEESNQNSRFYNNTKKAINQELEAENYKGYTSILPNMTLIEIMTTALNNNTSSFTKKAGTIADSLKLETSKTAD